MTTQKHGRKRLPLEVVIGRAIRHLRVKRGWNQRVLANRLGIKIERVRDYEAGRRPMGPRMLIRLARVFEAPLSAFFRSYRDRRPPAAMMAAPATYGRTGPLAGMPRPPARDLRRRDHGFGQERLRRNSASWSGS